MVPRFACANETGSDIVPILHPRVIEGDVSVLIIEFTHYPEPTGRVLLLKPFQIRKVCAVTETRMPEKHRVLAIDAGKDGSEQ